MAQKIIYKRYNIDISSADSRTKTDFELDKNVETVIGLTLTSDREDMLYHRGSIRLSLNGEEVFPEGYASKLLISGLAVPPDERYYRTELRPGNGMITLSFEDTHHPLAPFSPYRVSLYVKCLLSDA